MARTPEPPPRPGAPRVTSGWGWMVLGGLALALFAVALGTTLALLALGPRGAPLVANAAGIPFWWWVWRGAWLRTRWGRPEPGSLARWDEPTLRPRRAWWYTWLAAACAVALALALGIQIVRGHWI